MSTNSARIKTIRILSATWLALSLTSAKAAILYTPWTPLFKGIERATGTNTMDASGGPHIVQALRIDLHDPDVRLFTTPPNTNNYAINARETLSQIPANFLKTNHLKVAINGAHYAGNTSYTAPDGSAEYLHGIAISQGAAVSPSDYYGESDSLMLFTSNKVASFIASSPPSYYTTNEVYNYAVDNALYHAIPGIYPLVVDGANIGHTYDGLGGSLHSAQPRSAIGYSEDGRYLILLAIDGRQSDSNGAMDYETADWLILFGAYQGMNLDGGGSTCMVMADDLGGSVTLNDPSIQYTFRPYQMGAQRSVGHNIGVATRGFVENLVVNTGRTIAVLSWNSPAPTTTRVQYGPNLAQSTSLESVSQTNHYAVLTGLTPGATNYFQILTTMENGTHFSATNAIFTLIAASAQAQVFGLTNSWTYTTNNLDGVAWTTYSYNDSGWIGAGPGMLYVEDNSLVYPKNTPLPSPGGPGVTNTSLPRTYYFRTHFAFPSTPVGTSLTLSNFVDDGAVYYLNGTEVQRLRMSTSSTIYNSTLANSFSGTQYATSNPNYGDATTNNPAVFSLSGSLVATNLRQGDNVLAVEVHNYSAGSPDLVFGAALYSSASVAGNVLAIVASDPALRIPVQVTPTDLVRDTNMITPVERVFTTSTTATVTAPLTSGNLQFAKWQVDGIDYSSNPTVDIAMGSSHVMVAVYQPAPTWTLSVQSSATNQVPITVSPIDNRGLSSGMTPFERTYTSETTVTLTAPTTNGASVFQKWQKEGLDWTTDRMVNLVLSSNLSLVAVFTVPTAEPSTLNIRHANGHTVLHWTNAGWTLEYSTNLAAASWTNLPGSISSPYTNDSTDWTRYFRLRK